MLRVIISCRDIGTTSKLWADVLALPAPKTTTVKLTANSTNDFGKFASKAQFQHALMEVGGTQLEFVKADTYEFEKSESIKSRGAAIQAVVLGLADATAADRFKSLDHRSHRGHDLYFAPAEMLGIPAEWILVKNAAELKDLKTGMTSEVQELPPGADEGLRRLTQVSIAAKDVEAVSQRWARLLGIPPPKINTSEPDPKQLFWGHHSADRFTYTNIAFGPVAIEMLNSAGKDGTLVQQYLDTYGEGVQHVAFNVNDMDAAVQQFQRSHLPVAMMIRSQADMKINFVQAADKLGADVELIWRAPAAAAPIIQR